MRSFLRLSFLCLIVFIAGGQALHLAAQESAAVNAAPEPTQEAVTLPTQVLMEVRLGQVNATVRGTKHEYHHGDFWVAEK